MLPTDAKARKDVPLATGCFDYFPDALAAVAELSRIGNEQHNPGKPMFWDRSKSGDEADALARHLIERGKTDTDGVRHSAKVAWRALALLQKELEPKSETITKSKRFWAVVCTSCGTQWAVPYQHSGKTVCEECERDWRTHLSRCINS